MNDLAFPTPLSVNLNERSSHHGQIDSSQGLTKRELFAAMAMQAHITGNVIAIRQSSDFDLVATEVASASINCADALIAELERTK